MSQTTRSERYRRLLSEIQIGQHRLRNRVAHVATVTNFGRENRVTARLIDYARARAKGGTALLVTEGMSVHATSIPTPNIVTLFDPENRDGLKRMAGSVESEGCRLLGQLWHVGRQQLWNPVAHPVGVSERFDAYSWTVPHVMTCAEIAEIVEAFVDGARRLKESGFSGAELHGAHGYLITQFLSPWSNNREDDYGGDLDGRLRFLAEIVNGIREVCGDDFLLGVKLPSDEGVKDGIGPEEAARITGTIDAWGKLDYLAFNPGNFSLSLENHVPSMNFPPGPFLDLLPALKSASARTPVMAIGRIVSPAHAEEILADGCADLIGLSRALVSDAALVNKAAHGQEDDIRPCIFCNVCWGEIHAGKPIACVHNPELGTPAEANGPPAPAPRSRRIVVLGGGVAGLEAAWRAAAAGAEVVLFGRSTEGGGSAALDARLPGRADVAKAVDFQLAKARKHGVELRFGEEADRGKVTAMSPDMAIVATGATMQPPLLTKGAHRAQDLRGFAKKLLADGHPCPGTAVIFDQDHGAATYAAVELAAARFERVVVLTPRVHLARGVPYVDVIGIYRRLYGLGVDIRTAAVPVAVDGETLIYRNPFTEQQGTVKEVTAFAYATPRRAEDGLAASLKEAGLEVHLIGDCLAPRTLLAAIHEGYGLVARLGLQ